MMVEMKYSMGGLYLRAAEGEFVGLLYSKVIKLCRSNRFQK